MIHTRITSRVALEAVPPDRQVRTEPPVDEVTAEAVVKPVVLDCHVPRTPEEHEAVRPLDRAIPTVREGAAADPDVPRSPRSHRRGQTRSARGDDEVVEVDVLGVVDLDDRMLHDLGIDRSEIDSVAGEMSGLTEATRLRALLSTQLFP